MLSDEWLIKPGQIVVRWDRQRGRLSARSRQFATGSRLSMDTKRTLEPMSSGAIAVFVQYIRLFTPKSEKYETMQICVQQVLADTDI